MPRADSLRYDTFDELLTARDDEWRYGFLPSDRERMDKRGWKVLDPLWSTPVNEVRLARRARVAEADYRYADVAGPGRPAAKRTPARCSCAAARLKIQWNLYRLPDGLSAALCEHGAAPHPEQHRVCAGSVACVLWRSIRDRAA